MTRSPDQRLDAIEDELETAKRLLISAASYAESANLGLDRLTERQDRTQVQLDRLAVTVEDISTNVEDLTAAQTQTRRQLDELTAAQAQTQRHLDNLTGKVDQVSSRVDEFVFQAQRLFTQGGERLNNAEGRIERLEGILQLLNRDRVGHEARIDRLESIVQQLNRNYEAQQTQFQEFQRTTGAALERIDRVLDYLLRHAGE